MTLMILVRFGRLWEDPEQWMWLNL